MKIELFRESKAPVDIDAYSNYQSDWVKFFDSVQAKYGTNMEKMHKLLEYGENKKNKKHNKKVEIDFPNTATELEALCDKYKVPIMFAQRVDGKGLVGVLMDNYGS